MSVSVTRVPACRPEPPELVGQRESTRRANASATRLHREWLVASRRRLQGGQPHGAGRRSQVVDDQDPDPRRYLAVMAVDSYVEVARVAGEDAYRASVPFDVTVVPARLATCKQRGQPPPPVAGRLGGSGGSPSSFSIGCSPAAERSTIDSRVWARSQEERSPHQARLDCASGPRWRRAATAEAPRLAETPRAVVPAIPHMSTPILSPTENRSEHL